MQDMEALKGRVARLEKSLDDNREKVDELDTRLSLLREKLNSPSTGAADAGSMDLTPPPGLRVVELSDGSVRVESRPPAGGDQAGGAEAVAGGKPAVRESVDAGQNLKVLPRKTEASARSGHGALDKPASAKSLYKKAQDLYLAGRYAEARAVFSELARTFPGSSLSDNAFFWSGQSYFAEKDFEKAIENYEIVLKIYPKGNKAPDALLMMGLAYVRTGHNEKARQALTRLVKEYPGSEAAKKATKRLKSL